MGMDMTDLAKLDIAIAEAREFLKLARDLRPRLVAWDKRICLGDKDEPEYPVDRAAKVRASSLRVYRALIDLRRKEGNRL